MNPLTKFFSLFLFASVLTSCAYFPLRPGVGRIGNGEAYVRQSQNPKQQSSQKYERVTETVPANGTNKVVVVRTTEKGETIIGASQKDTAREISARLSSLSGVVWIGVLVFLFGAASLVWPPLKAIVGSVTTSAVLSAAGLALIFLPSLLVGHEVLLLAIAIGAAGIYWFAHRHGGVTSQLAALKAKVEPPKN